MTLSTGARLGSYEIAGLVGAGGMGEVYRARDTKLGREVAVKVLPERVASDPEALTRFEREAKAVAALSHPNILSIFDFGKEGGTVYAVMELLEGQTLREKLRDGHLPVRKAVETALQIAQGLAAAHEKGVVHRDLKPENIFVTHDTRVKILDFGLARQAFAPGADEHSPTETRHTEPGTVLGTVGYMSPEQVKGRAADHRSDIFSFGCVLYEMLSGRRAFQRETTAETMTAILKEEPAEIALSPPAHNPGLERIVRHCLEKNPEERFQSARDLAFDLQALSGSTIASGPAAVVAGKAFVRWLTGALLSGAIVGAIVASYRAGNRTGEGAGRRSAFADLSFRQMSFRAQAIFQAAFAPDGETIVYSAALEGNEPQLFTIRPEYPEPRPIGSPRTHLLSISSKGELAVLTHASFIGHRLFEGTLARLALGGGAPREVLEGVRQADWSPDGSELAIIRLAEGKDRLEFPIGKVLYETAGYLSDLRVSPRGDRIALFEHPQKFDDRGSVIVVDRAGKRTILADGYAAEEGLAWSGSGEEVFFTATRSGLNSFTLAAANLSGGLRVILRGAGGVTLHDVSRTGRWLVTRDDTSGSLMALPPAARKEVDLSWLDYSTLPHLSPDARLLLFTEEAEPAGGNYAVCLRRTDGGPVVRLGEGMGYGFSPDARWVFAVIHSTPPKLVIYPTGPGEARYLARGPMESYHIRGGWFPDGRSVVFCGNEAGKASRCYAQEVPNGLPRPITAEGTSGGLLAPEGKRILVSRIGGGYETVPLTGGSPQPVPALSPEDVAIRWSADGRSIFFFRPSNVPTRVERLKLDSGRRELVREMAPSDRTGVVRIAWVTLADTLESYAYFSHRMTSRLYVLEGAR